MSTPSSSSRHLVLYLWVIALVLVAVLVALKLRENQRQNQLPALRQQAYVSQQTASHNFYSALRHVLKAGMTRAQVEAAINGGKPILTHPVLAEGGEDGSHEWLQIGQLHDPKTGGNVDISFETNGSGWRYLGPSTPMIVQPPPTPGWIFVEKLRDRSARYFPWIWLLLLLVWPLVHRYVSRRMMGQFLLGLGIAWFADQLVAPNPSNTRLTEYFYDLGWPLAATLVGLSIVIGNFRKPRQDAALCVHCSYNLTGNISGVCPECGNLIVRSPARKI